MPLVSTRWTLIAQAQEGSGPERRAALEALIQRYWRPVYAYVRRKGEAEADALDLTQEFFARFLEKDYLATVDRAKGRFRSFLLACIEHFLANEYDRARAAKRGGGRPALSFEFMRIEAARSAEPATGESPGRVFDRQWALEVLKRSLDRLEEEGTSEGRRRWAEVLRRNLAGASYAEIAAAVGLSETDVTNDLHRARRRLGEILADEVRGSVLAEGEVAPEVRDLFAALS